MPSAGLLLRPREAVRWCVPALLAVGSRGAAPPQTFPRPASDGGVSLFLGANRQASVVAGAAASAGPQPGTELVGWGSYDDAIERTGWSVLDIHTEEAASGEDQGYAAGYLEGYLTHHRMKQHQGNMWNVDFQGKPAAANITPGAANFSDANMAWLKTQAQQLGGQDPYWRQVGFLLEQLKGLTDGYNAGRAQYNEPPTELATILMQSVVDTDMDDLMTAVVYGGELINAHVRHHPKHNVGHKRRRGGHSPRHPGRRHRGHCSALVQVAPDNKDLFTGHVTWDEYRAMLRVVKYFDMPLPGAKSRRMVFTSSPGSLYSGDDWYMTDAGLTVMETTIENYNATLWHAVQPKSAMNWVRTTVASRLATTGDEWTDFQVRYQSGTCNNQWMVVDYKKFRPGEPLADGTLWVSEAMPGYAHREDMTHVLREKGSWPSYNVPYFEDVWTMAGYREMQLEYPANADEYSFDADVRAKLFARAREEQWVDDLPSFMRLLRYSRADDPLSRGNACNALSARCDLNPMEAETYDCFGGVDAKVASFRNNPLDLSFLAVSGPTHDDEEKAFSWHGQNTSVNGCKKSQHVGQPDTFNFSWYALSDRAPADVAAPAAAASAGLLAAGGAAVLMAALVRTWRQRGPSAAEPSLAGYTKLEA